MTRICFTMQLRTESVGDYLRAHQSVWPEMLDALRDTGWRDYSLFVDTSTGLVVGYLETDDFAAAKAAMAERGVNVRWQAQMAQFFTDETAPDSTMRPLTEYFHLD